MDAGPTPRPPPLLTWGGALALLALGVLLLVVATGTRICVAVGPARLTFAPEDAPCPVAP